MSVPVAVWNKIEALEQAHAELAAKVDALNPNDEGMHTLPEKTAAQERYHEANEHHYSNREVEMAAGAFDRAEEVSQELDDWTHLIHMRLNTMSQRIASLESPAPAPDPVCAPCERCLRPLWVHPDGSCHVYHPLASPSWHCVPTAEPEPAPLDPVCNRCGHVESHHARGSRVCSWATCSCDKFDDGRDGAR